MQPSAHYSAAIEILDEVLQGVAAEKALLGWARRSRFAGSKDRAAIRDIVFDILRKRASFAARFGLKARGLALGRALDCDELELFTGEGFAPAPLNAEEKAQSNEPVKFEGLWQEFDFPEFLESELIAQYGDDLPQLMNVMRERAPVDLRVNRLKTDPQKVEEFLARDHIFVEALDLKSALRVVHNPRRLASSRAYNYGFVELQDVSSQLVARFARAKPNMKVLDYCAGGGGKALALVMDMQGQGQLAAWDVAPARMKEIPERAARAGAQIEILKEKPQGQFDLVMVDAPCSGAGAWRRNPDAKWRLDETRLNELSTLQLEILNEASQCVKGGACLVYATCSILKRENQDIRAAFLMQNKEFELEEEIGLNPLNAGDGFYAARMRKRA